jgi:hypothetical protein
MLEPREVSLSWGAALDRLVPGASSRFAPVAHAAPPAAACEAAAINLDEAGGSPHVSGRHRAGGKVTPVEVG